MLGWFKALMPREDRFFDMFSRHASTVVEAARELDALLNQQGSLAERAQRIIVLEHEADLITRDVLQAVRKSFITPFDRSDITDLIQSMDDAVDKMQRVVKTVQLYDQTEFDAGMRKMGAATVEAAVLMADAIGLLRSINSNAGRINEITEAIVRIEARADDIHDEGLRALYRQYVKTDPVQFFIGRGLYIDLEGVVDSIEDVANEVNSLTIEHL